MVQSLGVGPEIQGSLGTTGVSEERGNTSLLIEASILLNILPAKPLHNPSKPLIWGP